MNPKGIEQPSEYGQIVPDPRAKGAMKFPVPAGFTGQGCLWFASTAPDGWLICDGSSLLRTDYPELFNVIGTTYGAADGTHFSLPDLRQRVPVGKHSSGTFNTLGGTPGAETGNLAHTHDVSGVTSNMVSLVAGVAMTSGATAINHSHNFAATSTGASIDLSAVSRVQPSLVINFIIKV